MFDNFLKLCYTFSKGNLILDELISVIIPVYKVEKYIHKCVDSILSQTYKNLEVILVDDGSPDNCPAICDEYAKSDKRVRVIHKKNGGLSDARNAGLSVCRGGYISFVDGDDWIEPNFLEEMLKNLKEKNVDVVSCEIMAFFEQSGEHRPHYRGKKKDIFFENSEKYYEYVLQYAVAVWCRLYKRKVFENVKFPVNINAEDLYILAEMMKNISSAMHISKYLYNYRIRQNSIMNSVDEKIFDFIVASKKNIADTEKFYPNLAPNAIRRAISTFWWVEERIFSANNKSLNQKFIDEFIEFRKKYKKYESKKQKIKFFILKHFNWALRLTVRAKKKLKMLIGRQ